MGDGDAGVLLGDLDVQGVMAGLAGGLVGGAGELAGDLDLCPTCIHSKTAGNEESGAQSWQG